MKNLLECAENEAEKGRTYCEKLKKLQAEMILFNDSRIKIERKLQEMENLQAHKNEQDFLTKSYLQELSDMKHIVDIKSAQMENCRSRVNELEQQIQRRDNSLTDQKRLLKLVKDEYEEKFHVRLI